MVGGEADNQNFYYKGKWFNTAEEMFEYAEIWQKLAVTEASLSLMLSHVKIEILLNLIVSNKKVTNQDCEEILNDAFLKIMEKRN